MDLLYALQDAAFDEEWGVYSFPSILGPVKTLKVARMLHAGAFFFFMISGLLLHASWPYWLSMVLVLLIFFGQHRLIVKTTGPAIGRIFFISNASLSLILLLGSMGTWLVSL